MSALFDMPPGPPAPTPGERRRARHALAVAHGQHPLTVALRIDIPLHSNAPTGDKTDPGPRCGSCVYRRTFGGHAKRYPKCTAGANVTAAGTRYPRRTNGPGTDVLASWPACTDYQPKEA